MAGKFKFRPQAWVALSLKKLKVKSKNLIPKYLLAEEEHNSFDRVHVYYPYLRINGESYA